MRGRAILFGVALLAAFQPACRQAVGQESGSLFESFAFPSVSRENDNESGGEEHLETDRDSFTPATTVIGAGRFVFESSYSFLDERETADTHSFPEILTRYGVTEWLELRLGWNYEIGGGGSVSGEGEEEEFEEPGTVRESKILYGLKAALTEQEGWRPQSACIIQGRTPTSGPESASDFQLGYVFGWKLFNDWQLDSSVRYIAAEEEADHFNEWAPSIVLKVPVGERWNVHAEYFGLFTDGREDETNDQYFSPGIHYLVSPDCEVGVRVGWGLNDDAANFFSNVGLGLRL